MRDGRVAFMARAAMIAAAYVVLTVFVSAFQLASGAIQVRVSEALTVLPYFTPAAVPGLFIGCILANLLTGAGPLDVVFGSLATLIGAVGTYLLRGHRLLCTLPPVLSNMIIIPLVLRYGYGLEMSYGGIDVSIPFYMVTVGAGEAICCCALGQILIRALSGARIAAFGDGAGRAIAPREKKPGRGRGE